MAGDQLTSHFPCALTRCSVEAMLTVPSPASASRSVNGSVAVDPDCVSVPAVNRALWTDRLVNAA